MTCFRVQTTSGFIYNRKSDASDVLPMSDAAHVSGTVTAQARGFLRFQEIRITASGCFPTDHETPIGSLVAKM